MAGHDPASVRLRLVLDMTWAILVEVYRDYDMRFFEAHAELNKQLSDPDVPKAQQRVSQESASTDAASVAVLQALMRASDFGGPTG